MTGERILFENLPSEAGQAVETAAEIDWGRGDEHPNARRDRKHHRAGSRDRIATVSSTRASPAMRTHTPPGSSISIAREAGGAGRIVTSAKRGADATTRCDPFRRRCQRYSRSTPSSSIAYPGSIARLHYGEAGDKGFLLWTVDADSANAGLVVTPAREMVSIEFQGKPDWSQLNALVSTLDGAFVRVRWAVMEEDRNQVDRNAIITLLNHAAEVKLEERVIPLQRQRVPGIGDAVSLSEKLRLWATTQGVNGDSLVARLAVLAHKPAEDICQAYLSALAVDGRSLT